MTTYSERVLQQAYSWMRGHPRVADGILALALLASSSGQIPRQMPYLLTGLAVNVLLAGAVAVRRPNPVAPFITAVLVVIAQLAFGFGPGGATGLELTVTDAAIVILLYSLAAYRPRRTSLAGLVICLAGAAVAIARYAPLHEANAGDVLLLSIVAVGVTLLAAWVLGDSVAYRRSYYISLEERLATAERARDLEEKRARAVDASEARLRRIERDLHDGAQVRLAALAMALGEIKENLAQAEGDGKGGEGGEGGEGEGSEKYDTLKLVDAAHRNAKDALAELRDLARGIHPPVLDRGLRPALSVLAETSAIPVALTVDLIERPSPAIEAIAYYCTAELLANATKHAAARNVTISVREQDRERDGGLRLTVADDGAGGARIAPGGGLAGLLERVQTVDGRLEVDSPAGGPTTITIELPRHA